MPKLKSVVENLEGVPEAYRGSYVEREGKFYLDEIDVEDTSGLKSALQRERDERKAAKEALDKFKDLDPDKAREALQKLQDAEEAKLKDKGKFDELKTKWDEQKAKDLKERDDKIAELSRGLRKFQLDDKVRAAALKAGVLAEDIEDVMTITSRRFDLDDKGRIVVLDGDGDPMDATVETFFDKTFKEQRPKFYAASNSGGSGAPAGGSDKTPGGTRTVSSSDQSSLNDNLEKIASGEVSVS